MPINIYGGGSSGGGVGGGGNSYTDAFVNADLSSGILTVNHSLNTSVVHVTIYNDSNVQVTPDAITLTDANNVAVDLSSFGVITGTWNAKVST